MTLDIDVAHLVSLVKASLGQIEYEFGAKPAFGSAPGDDNCKTSDCSGFVRWLIYSATGGEIELPLASYHQLDWCTEHGLDEVDYAESAPLCDSQLRIAFTRPRGERVGHVWLVLNGETIECFGECGAGHRAWNTPKLLNNADACFVLTRPH